MHYTSCYVGCFLAVIPGSILGAIFDIFPAEIDGTIPIANPGLIYGATLFGMFFWKLFLALYGMLFWTLIGTLIGMLIGMITVMLTGMIFGTLKRVCIL